jgi:hypothetical protein
MSYVQKKRKNAKEVPSRHTLYSDKAQNMWSKQLKEFLKKIGLC